VHLVGVLVDGDITAAIEPGQLHVFLTLRSFEITLCSGGGSVAVTTFPVPVRSLRRSMILRTPELCSGRKMPVNALQRFNRHAEIAGRAALS